MTPITPASRQQSEDVALLWVTRLAAEPDNRQLAEARLSPQERGDLQRWLDADTGNAQAYARARQLWQLTAMPAARLAGEEDAALQAILRRGRQRPRRRLAALAIAASLLFAAVSMLAWQPERWIDNLQADYSSAPGQLRTVTLADGSEVTLDGDSALDVSVTDSARNVHLRRGAAFFKVRHTGQAFVVHADTGEVTVLGTRFEVRREAHGTGVTVEEGRVAVSPLPGIAAQVLTAGERIDYRDGHAGALQSVDPRQAFAWRDGRLSFRRVPLADALAVVQRYYPQRIVLLDSSLGARPVSGEFSSQDPTVVLAAFQAVLGFSQQRLPGGTLLIH
ncbi:FecR domain-containing protein [Pseudomonas sp. MWU16-30317]|uniref:FecR family protein n=1 Tax=Pseudomonas sp. MWU16-30317 TaxID=2878095 RepID=UPI001CFB421A|nr:FecR domain-containing protein [Pseudomonas sp. MWU16-30317]